MGTDIHFYVERRENGQWVSCDTWEPDEYADDPKPLTVPYKKHFYGNRNYDVFAIFADVRNGTGFAGVDTGDGFNIISPPRGLPDDMSPELTKEAESCDHTPSWLLVSEIMAFDWTQVTTQRGWVSAQEYYNWRSYSKGEGKAPREYSGGISGARIEHVSVEEMEKLIVAIEQLDKDWHVRAAKVKSMLADHYCQVSWETPYYREASDFLSETLPRLWRLGKPEDVRCVFWFDS